MDIFLCIGRTFHGDLRAERRQREREPQPPEVGDAPQAGHPAAQEAGEAIRRFHVLLRPRRPRRGHRCRHRRKFRNRGGFPVCRIPPFPADIRREVLRVLRDHAAAIRRDTHPPRRNAQRRAGRQRGHRVGEDDVVAEDHFGVMQAEAEIRICILRCAPRVRQRIPPRFATHARDCRIRANAGSEEKRPFGVGAKS